MKKSLTLSIIAVTSMLFTYAQTPTIVWQATIGGTNDDSLVSILPTADGGFIISGHSNSNISGNKSQNSVGNSFDYWILKLTSTGRIQWDRTIGGDRTDRDPVVIPTID